MSHYNPKISKGSNFFIENGSRITNVGKALETGFMVAGERMGMYIDLTNNDKTIGEAVVHHGTLYKSIDYTDEM